MKKVFSALVMVMGLLMVMAGSASAHHKPDHSNGPPPKAEQQAQVEQSEPSVQTETAKQSDPPPQAAQPDKAEKPDKVEKPDKTDEAPKKVFVCKYVGKPGVDERLQTGNNPISVSVNAIPNYQGVGSYFADGQYRSFVLAEDNRTGGGQEGEPSVSQCPTPVGPPTTPPTTAPPTTKPPVVTVPPVTVPPVTTPPVTTPPEVGPTPTTVVNTVVPPLAVPKTVPVPKTVATTQPAVRTQLAETGASDSLPVLTLSGIGLLVLGVAMSRKSQRI